MFNSPLLENISKQRSPTSTKSTQTLYSSNSQDNYDENPKPLFKTSPNSAFTSLSVSAPPSLCSSPSQPAVQENSLFEATANCCDRTSVGFAKCCEHGNKYHKPSQRKILKQENSTVPNCTIKVADVDCSKEKMRYSGNGFRVVIAKNFLQVPNTNGSESGYHSTSPTIDFG